MINKLRLFECQELSIIEIKKEVCYTLIYKECGMML